MIRRKAPKRYKDRHALIRDLPTAIVPQPRAKREKSLRAEEHDQHFTEQYLDLVGLPYIHIENCIYHTIFGIIAPMLNNQAVVGAMHAHGFHIPRNFISEAKRILKGKNDLMIFDPIPGSKWNRCLMLELKTNQGKMTREQKEWGAGLNLVEARHFEEAQPIIDEFRGARGH